MAVKWTDTRYSLLEALRGGVHADAADLYQHAIDALSNDPLSRTELAVGTHCLRELFSAIPGMLNRAKPGRVDADGALRALAEAWAEAPLDLEPTPGGPPTEVQPIPGFAFEAAKTAAREGSRANENARIVTAIVVTGSESDHDLPSVRQVHRAVAKLPRWAHFVDYSKPLAPMPSVDEVEVEVSLMEIALLTQYANRFDSLRSLRDALAEANRREEEEPS